MNDHNITGLGHKSQLFAGVTWLMLKGAGYAAITIIGVWLIIAVIAGIGRLLPAESRDTPDPTPTSFLMITTPDTGIA